MKFEFSAGGVIFKTTLDAFGKKEILILVAQHSQHKGWVFPKGLIGDNIKGETKENTAVREVKEETGVKAKIITPLQPVTYWYVWEGEKIRKAVYYFIMDFIEGDFAERDMEMENVEWIKIEDVENKLTYKSDKKTWEEAKNWIISSKI
ncbi:NUDIX domain-containing protein [Patescibacteria group bacterium]|nr:NUDIX domain-containing protein [Patescibacteria group bacterium]